MTEEIEVTRTYLELNDRSALHSARIHDADIRVDRAARCTVSFYRYLYREVGKLYHWHDRYDWDDETVQRNIDNPRIAIWVMYVAGVPAGYFELSREADASVEIVHFGLLPEFIGHGLGKHLLAVATEEAWRDGARSIWLHTCTLDNKAALPNYIKRGFVPFREEKYKVIRDVGTRGRGT
ncbi:MAG: GNAT family N-acetyltransferase [Gemmatimonadaceae bacterium]